MQQLNANAPTGYDVVRTYAVMLGRVPENPSMVPNQVKAAKTTLDLVRIIAHSQEFIDRVALDVDGKNPFWHFNACIDVRAIIEAHVNPDRKPLPGHYVNFLGAAAPTKVMSFLQDLGGQVGEAPIPANYHADMAEWGGALRAVDLAGDRFTMIELGCGWACWMSNTGVAARAKGCKVELIGVEADATHLGYARDTLAVNGFLAHEYKLVTGIAAASDGYALFPKRSEGDEHWGFAPVFGATFQESEKAVASGKFESTKMVPLSKLIGDRPKIDLLHMDIQGGEADLVDATIDLLSERVAYLVVGTHSRQLEGRLFESLLSAGWALEVERPAIFTMLNGKPEVTVDGIQSWKNLKFHPLTL